jgi:hypothetical protein
MNADLGTPQPRRIALGRIRARFAVAIAFFVIDALRVETCVMQGPTIALPVSGTAMPSESYGKVTATAAFGAAERFGSPFG